MSTRTICGRDCHSPLCERLEGLVQGPIITHASYTARPFCAQLGYRLVLAQSVERRGVKLTNFVMRKDR